ncbi:MAG: hypothetical protein ACR2PK_07645 [Acidimicrobiales bacterium]
MAELGDSDESRYRLFELNRECSADIPGRGPFHPWEQYRERRLEVPWFDAHGVSIAVDEEDWAGMAAFTAHPGLQGDGHLFGYPEVTNEIKAKILGLNAAKLYGVDPEEARCVVPGDLIGETKEIYEEQELASPSNRRYGPTTRREFFSLLRSQGFY